MLPEWLPLNLIYPALCDHPERMGNSECKDMSAMSLVYL